MQVILIKDVEKLGYANDIVDVKPGYANNFLLPQGYAKVATESAKKVLAEKGVEVDRKVIALDAVKTLGEYVATVKLHREVKATVHFSVVAE